MYIIPSHLPSFYFIFTNVLIQQRKGAGRLPTTYILEQFLKEGNGGNLRQKSGQLFETYDLLTPAVRSRMQLFCFDSLDFIYKLQFPDPKILFFIHIWLLVLIYVGQCVCMYACVCVCVYNHM